VVTSTSKLDRSESQLAAVVSSLKHAMALLALLAHAAGSGR
jgi:hypothetical protein